MIDVHNWPCKGKQHAGNTISKHMGPPKNSEIWDDSATLVSYNAVIVVCMVAFVAVLVSKITIFCNFCNISCIRLWFFLHPCLLKDCSGTKLMRAMRLVWGWGPCHKQVITPNTTKTLPCSAATLNAQNRVSIQKSWSLTLLDSLLYKCSSAFFVSAPGTTWLVPIPWATYTVHSF